MDNLEHETDLVHDPLNGHEYVNNSNDVSVIDDDVIIAQGDADESETAFRKEQDFPLIRDGQDFPLIRNEEDFPHIRDEQDFPLIRDKEFTSMSPTTEEADHPFQYSSDTSDLRLIVEGKPLYVSRVVLSLISPVLKR